MTLTALNPSAITPQGVAAFGPGIKQGEAGKANAVSAVVQPKEPQGAGPAFTGIIDGAQKNTDAIIMLVTILRSFMGGPSQQSRPAPANPISQAQPGLSRHANKHAFVLQVRRWMTAYQRGGRSPRIEGT